MRIKNLILGSGIGGLAAAAAFRERNEEFLVVDKCPSIPLNLQNGVHYLHSDNFGTPFPFEFKKITSTEEIWNPRTDEFKKTSHLPEMIEYSLKVMNLRHPSSIMDPGNRQWETYLPLSNNMNDLLEAYYTYIGKENFRWGEELIGIRQDDKRADFTDADNSGFQVEYENIISTIPLPNMLKMVGIDHQFEFKHNPIYVTNYETKNIVPNWLISIYICDNAFPPHRITILNNLISMESIKPLTVPEEHIVKYHLGRYFDYELESKKSYCWETGRIFGISKLERQFLVKALIDLDIYPCGRFGLWNGKLLIDSTAVQAKEIVSYLSSPFTQLSKLIEKLSI